MKIRISKKEAKESHFWVELTKPAGSIRGKRIFKK
jgi:hypothetical protein